MPAILTHDFFARDMLENAQGAYGTQEDERNAFILGNQGPDPLFYLAASPKYFRLAPFGSTMHSKKTTLLLAELKWAVNLMPEDERDIAHAYARGFLCHYALDRSMHPLVYANEYALCDAGVDGLSRKDGNEIHAVIESELDEMVLYTKRGLTIADYAPAANTLHASDKVLRIIGKLYVAVALNVYSKFIGLGMFPTAVRDFRFVQALFYSPTGAKRDVIADIEQIFRPYSFYRAMSHRAVELETSAYDNHEHNTWINPFTGASDTRDFWDIYTQTLDTAQRFIAEFDCDDFDRVAALRITEGMDFSGKPSEE